MLSDSWTDEDGYSFKFELQTTVATAKKDTANAKPGLADIYYDFKIAGALTNTTPQRNANVHDKVSVEPLGPATSAICKTGIQTQPAFSYDNTADDNWCTLNTSPMRFDLSPGPIEMGGTKAISTDWDNTPAVTGGAFSNYPKFSVPEGQADAVIADLENPTGWAFARQSGTDLKGAHCFVNASTYLTKSTISTRCS